MVGFYFNYNEGNINTSSTLTYHDIANTDAPKSSSTNSQSPLFDGMYANYTITWYNGSSGFSNFTYAHYSENVYNVSWTVFNVNGSLVNGSWNVNNKTRVMSNSKGMSFGDGNHSFVWIFNISFFDRINISVPEEEHEFTVIDETSLNLTNFTLNDNGTVDAWVLEKNGSIAWYEKSSGLLLNGTFIYKNDLNYTLTLINTNINFTYSANFNPPLLTKEQVSPKSGDPTTLFTFTVTYTDADNNYPIYVRAVISGKIQDLEKDKASIRDMNYTDGCTYTRSLYLSPGFYVYYFESRDWNYTTTTLEKRDLKVEVSKLEADDDIERIDVEKFNIAILIIVSAVSAMVITGIAYYYYFKRQSKQALNNRGSNDLAL